MTEPWQSRLIFQPFDIPSLEATLKLQPPPLQGQAKVFRQFREVMGNVSKLACQGVVIESHYIDRDHIDDHSVFYSKSLFPYSNSCQRIHFFREAPDYVRARLRNLLVNARGRSPFEFAEECRQYSISTYLGFMVLRPLPGCPVGRTAICPPESPNRTSSLDLCCTRTYVSHLAGIELTVGSLPFQQQDVGVSACATTALWSTLQHFQLHEPIQAASPSMITACAAKHSYPEGRAMPSEGLSLGQMCFALNSFGVAPMVFRATEQPDDARRVIYSALKSSFAPILLLENVREPKLRHAVTAVGAVLDNDKDLVDIEAEGVAVATDAAAALSTLLIHDDRVGPYRESRLAVTDGSLQLEMDSASDSAYPRKEWWRLLEVLIPMHSKIRISLPSLFTFGEAIVCRIGWELSEIYRHARVQTNGSRQPLPVIEAWFDHGHLYARKGLFQPDALSTEQIEFLTQRLSLPRYVGVIQISLPGLCVFDLLVDSTCTIRNPRFIGVIPRNVIQQRLIGPLLQLIAHKCGNCPVVS